MSVSGVSSSPLSYTPAAETQRAVLVLKKQQSAEQAQAQALLELIKASSSQVGQRINVYA